MYECIFCTLQQMVICTFQCIFTLCAMCLLSLFQKKYIGELEDTQMKLSKVNGKLKEEIQDLEKEKERLVDQLSIVEVCTGMYAV